MSRKIILIKQELLLLVYELNRRDCWRKMRKFDLSLRSSRSSYFATFRHQLTILSKTDALDEEKWSRLITISTTPVIAGDSFEMDAVGALRLSPLRRGLAIDSTVDIFTFYVPHRHVYGEQWIKFMKDGVNATPLPTVNTTGYIDHAAFLGTINPDTNKIPKHLFQGYLNIYNNYFKAPWMPDRTEANPNELNQDDARYGFRCCHLKNIWTAPLPPETELSRQMTTSTTSIDIMGLQAAYANLHTDQERDYFMQRYHDVISSFGGKTSYDADNRPLLVMRSNLWASGYDVDGTEDRKSG